MSKVLEQSKKMYQKALFIEVLFFSFLSIFTISYHFEIGVLISLGFLCGFLPQCFFLFFVLFRHRFYRVDYKITSLYYGEAFKIALTIVLITTVFITYKKINWLFFVGYFFALLLNNIFPMYLKFKADKN